jgi:hypothetical protein
MSLGLILDLIFIVIGIIFIILYFKKIKGKKNKKILGFIILFIGLYFIFNSAFNFVYDIYTGWDKCCTCSHNRGGGYGTMECCSCAFPSIPL